MVRMISQHKLRTESGMTFVETMVAIGIFVVLLGGIMAALNVSMQYTQSNKVQVELYQELRMATAWMSSELRQASSSSIVNVDADGTWYSTIWFKVPVGVSASSTVWSSDTIIYELVIDDEGDSQLRRVEGEDIKIIAHDILRVQFRRMAATSDILEVALAAQKDTVQGRTITKDIEFSIQLRN